MKIFVSPILFLLLAAPVARASDLLDCLETGVLPFTNLQDIQETAEFLYDNGECVQYILPPDGVRIGVIVGGGEVVKLTNNNRHFFIGKNQCENLAGNTVAKALLDTGFGDVFNVIDSHAKDYLKYAASEGVNEEIQQIPVIGGFVPCICGFSVTHFSFDNPKQVFAQYAQSIQACENVAKSIADAAKSVVDAIESAFSGGDPFTYDKFYNFAYAPYVTATMHVSQSDLTQYLSGVGQMCHYLVSLPFDITTFNDAGCDQMQSQFLAARASALQSEQQQLAAAAKAQQDAMEAAEKQQQKEDDELRKKAASFARAYALLEFGLWSPKCHDKQCFQDVGGISLFYSMTLYSAFYQSGGDAEGSLAKGKPYLASYKQKTDESAARAAAKALQEKALAHDIAQSYVAKKLRIAPSVQRAQLVGQRFHVRNRSDFTRLVRTYPKPNMYRGKPYIRHRDDE